MKPTAGKSRIDEAHRDEPDLLNDPREIDQDEEIDLPLQRLRRGGKHEFLLKRERDDHADDIGRGDRRPEGHELFQWKAPQPVDGRGAAPERDEARELQGLRSLSGELDEIQGHSRPQMFSLLKTKTGRWRITSMMKRQKEGA